MKGLWKWIAMGFAACALGACVTGEVLCVDPREEEVCSLDAEGWTSCATDTICAGYACPAGQHLDKRLLGLHITCTPNCSPTNE